MPPLRIAAFCASLRKGSYNRSLLAVGESVLRELGVEIDHLELKDFPLPLYDFDIQEEQGFPDLVWKLKARMAACHGILIASPEYNYGIPGAFKNAIDWTSRGTGNPWAGKVVGMMGASNGPIATWRGMISLRATLSGLQALVIPQQMNVGNAGKVWDEAGSLIDNTLPERVEKMVKEFVRITTLLKIETTQSL